MDDKLNIAGVLSQGYGIIPKMLMRDKSLSIEAKAIYAYICSYAGNGSTAFPSISLICSDLGIGEKRFHTHKKDLIEKGYIKVEQERGTRGKFNRNVYTINSVLMPTSAQDVVEPTPQNSPTVDGSPTGRYRSTDGRSTDEPCSAGKGTNNNSINNNSINKNSINNNNNNKEAVVVVPENNLFEIYKDCFGDRKLSKVTKDVIAHWQKEIGDDLVKEAMKRAALNQKSFAWAMGIMESWSEKKFKSIGQVEADDALFAKRNRPRFITNNSVKKEIEPSLFSEPQPTEEELLPDDIQAKFDERLMKFREGASVK